MPIGSGLATSAAGCEVDLVVERNDGRVLAEQVTLSATVADNDVRRLRRLAGESVDRLADAADEAPTPSDRQGRPWVLAFVRPSGRSGRGQPLMTTGWATCLRPLTPNSSWIGWRRRRGSSGGSPRLVDPDRAGPQPGGDLASARPVTGPHRGPEADVEASW